MPPRHPKRLSNPPVGCLVPFFGVFALMGLFAGVMLLREVRRDIQARTSYHETRCTIVERRLVESSDSDGTTYRPEFDFDVHLPSGPVRARGYDGWTTSSSGRSSHERVLEQFAIGESYPCWYDVGDPARAVLVHGASLTNYLLLLIPLIFTAVGVGGIWFTLSSGRKQRARARSGGPDEWLPEVRLLPATRLAARLRPTTQLGTSVLGMLLLMLFWNGLTGAAVWAVASTWHDSGPQWIAAAFLSLFVLVGLAIAWGFVRSVLVRLGVRDVVVEIAPAQPRIGDRLEVLVELKSRVRVTQGEVRLRCVERASYSVGTDTRTETKTVHDQLVDARAGGFDAVAGPFVLSGSTSLPDDAMHSFRASRNAVEWQLVVLAKLEGLPKLEQQYLLRVRP